MAFKYTVTAADIHERPVAKWYSDYLQTKKWKDKVAKLVKLRGSICEMCGINAYNYAHHITYHRVKKERLTDIRLLCKICHYIAHKKHDIPLCYLIYIEDWNNRVRPVRDIYAFTPDFKFPTYR